VVYSHHKNNVLQFILVIWFIVKSMRKFRNGGNLSGTISLWNNFEKVNFKAILSLYLESTWWFLILTKSIFSAHTLSHGSLYMTQAIRNQQADPDTCAICAVASGLLKTKASIVLWKMLYVASREQREWHDTHLEYFISVYISIITC
jgi:hypothetical protein